ncbi:MAG: hypothetical protein AAGC55_21250, partial [Myxococcota bacterium]
MDSQTAFYNELSRGLAIPTLEGSRTMLEQRGTDNIRVLYIGESSHLNTAAMSAGPMSIVSEWIVAPTLSRAIEMLSSEARYCFNLNLVIFHITVLANEPHLALKILSFAPIAARVLMYESPTDRAVMEMSPLFDMTCQRPEGGMLRPDALYWYRAGISGTIRAFNEVPTAFMFVHKMTGFVLSANDAALQLLESESFDGGTLSDLIQLPAE